MESKSDTWFVCVVQHDHTIVVGGPVGKKRALVTFVQGEHLRVSRDHSAGIYPKMYMIEGRKDLGLLSRGVMTLFLAGFEATDERPEHKARA